MYEFRDRDNISSEELVDLLALREDNNADFVLVDVRETMEYDRTHIKGVDVLKATSMLPMWFDDFIDEYKDKNIVFTCRTGLRSGNIHRMFEQNGHKNTLNHKGGITSYSGERGRIKR